jgi:AmmeMemoRadiSam system protein A
MDIKLKSEDSLPESASPSLRNHETLTSLRRVDESALPALARSVVETFTLERRIIEAPSVPQTSLLNEKAACFISIKTFERELRGCVGTIEPGCSTLAEEIIANAIKAATRDPRFPTISAAELPFLHYSVDVLSRPEPARFDELDPKTFGVIVEDGFGLRRGLLLPDIEDIKTAAQQIQVAARKAEIPLGDPLKLYRFRVRRFSESLYNFNS